MPPLQPEHAIGLLNTLLGSMRTEQPITTKVIEAIPLDKSDFRHDEVSRTALDLAWHIVNTERVFLEAVAAGEFNVTPFSKPETITNSAELSAWYGRMFEEKTAILSQLTPDQLSKIIDFRGLVQMPAVAFLQFALNHTIHHRGQLSMYLRPMGAKVPNIYGESYDGALARTQHP